VLAEVKTQTLSIIIDAQTYHRVSYFQKKGEVSVAPQSPQNFSPGWIVAPHFGQKATSDAPQFVKNLRPSRLSLPHFEQRIFPPMPYRPLWKWHRLQPVLLMVVAQAPSACDALDE
jgi:hypothetical protein